MSYRGARLSEQHRERIGAGIRRFHQRKREEAKRRHPLPRDLELWQERGVLRDELHPLIAAAEHEGLAVLEARGGADVVSPQVISMVRSHTRLGVAEEILTGLLLRNPDEPDLASRLATVATARARILQLVGLDRVQRDVPDLRSYLERADLSRNVSSKTGCNRARRLHRRQRKCAFGNRAISERCRGSEGPNSHRKRS